MPTLHRRGGRPIGDWVFPARFVRRWRVRAALVVAALTMVSTLSLALSVVTAPPAFADTTFQLTGGGWGHGVGMGQYGALGMSQQGVNAPGIIQSFYASTAIQGLSQPSNIRVQLHSAIGSTTVTGDGTVHYWANGNHYGQGGPGQPVTISAAGDHIR